LSTSLVISLATAALTHTNLHTQPEQLQTHSSEAHFL